jgi:hypothetical protein
MQILLDLIPDLPMNTIIYILRAAELVTSENVTIGLFDIVCAIVLQCRGKTKFYYIKYFIMIILSYLLL